MMPTGLRGVGKTVLLNRFADQGRELDYRVALVEAPETGNLAILLAAQLRTVLLELDRLGAISSAVRRGMRVLKSFSMTPRADGMPTFEISFDPERGVADSGNLSADISDLVVAVGEAARDRGCGLLIAIDEVQYLSETELAAIISAIHRTTQLALHVSGC
jgi:KaiC/GvpD/RAD55 family RecA-like ATPase